MIRRRNVLLSVMVSISIVGCTRSASTEKIPGQAPSRIPPIHASISETVSKTYVPTQKEPTQPATPKTLLSTATPLDVPPGVSINELPINGLSTNGEEQISGMAWYQDRLILLPQYPNSLGIGGVGKAFAIEKSELIRFIMGDRSITLSLVPINFIDTGIMDRIPGFQGYEAIAIQGDRVYITIEAGILDMEGYVVGGSISSDGDTIRVDPSVITRIAPQTNLYNYSEESVLIFGNRLVTIYEINGESLNPDPVAHLLNLSLQPVDNLSFPNVEFRITDATPPDDSGRFWAINDYYPGDQEILPHMDSVTTEYPHQSFQPFAKGIERLIEFQFSESGIVFSDTPPIQLELRQDGVIRNWEAIARLEGYGFVVATDQYPGTMIAYIPHP